jgi:16S rRNA G966 N2-methylase RsmD
MPYQFATERPDYSDLASGRVFYNLPGYPAFPIRLADEILQRCLAIRHTNQLTGPITMYDPCCGGAYHLSVLASLHWKSFRVIIGSDVDPSALQAAQKNLGLLNPTGMAQRVNEISGMLQLYGKESHREALASAHRLQDKIATLAATHPLNTRTFQANALDQAQLQENLKSTKIDIVFADVPYGLHSQWQLPASGNDAQNPLWQMLEAVSGVLLPTSIVAIAFDKGQKASHEKYQRVEQFQVGKRRIAILKPKG